MLIIYAVTRTDSFKNNTACAKDSSRQSSGYSNNYILSIVSIIYQRVKKIKKLHFGLAKLVVSV